MELSTAVSAAGDARSDRHDLPTFLERYRDKLRAVFHGRADIDRLSLQRGLPPFVLREIRSCDPLTVWIPEEYGGRGGHTHECIAMLAVTSYESLPLSLAFGINGALFLQPLARYGAEETKNKVFRRFVEGKAMGGLMITEPEYGSDALRMQTGYTCEEGYYRIRGVKHWGGLTGWADYWLVTARPLDADAQLGRDIDFFVCDTNDPDQRIEVEEFYENLGLYLIPYGRNRLDLKVPEAHRLRPHTTGIKMMLDILHRSRAQFPGMAQGFLHRMFDEALEHTRERMVGGQSLIEYDQVKERLARLQAYFTTCSAMCAYTSREVHLAEDQSRANVPANSIKAVVTDMMQEAAQSLLQLVGAKGYRLDHIAGRATVDSRPFQIFEGSNDILYQQITEAVLKGMRRMKETNLHRFLESFDLTSRAADHFKDVLNFDVDVRMPQRKLVELGRILGRVFSMELTIDLGERGFRSDLVGDALTVFRNDVRGLVEGYLSPARAGVQVDYRDGSDWLAFVGSGD